jgi:zinc protease
MPGASLNPARQVLDNGLVVVVKETRKTPAVTINLAIRAGSVCDPADALGATQLLSRLVDRGTSTRSGAEIADALDNRGISLSFNVTRHLFSVVCTCLAADFDEVLALLADVVMSPSLPSADVELRRGELVTALRQDEDNPGVRAAEGAMALLYGPEHPYGRPAKGTVASVEALTRDRLIALHARGFAPSAASLVVVGDVAMTQVFAAATAVFGAWRHDPPPDWELPAPPPQVSRRRVVIPMMNKSQTDIAYGFTTITRSDPDYYSFWLLNIVLGQYALGGRLGDNIRERQGMAYYVSSAFDPNIVAGPLLVRAGVSAANVDRAIQAIDAEIAALVREGVTEKELNESRQYLVGSMPRALETNVGIAQFLQSAEFFGLGLDYDRRLPALLGAVTRGTIHRVAQQHLDPGLAAIVIAGPYEER